MMINIRSCIARTCTKDNGGEDSPPLVVESGSRWVLPSVNVSVDNMPKGLAPHSPGVGRGVGSWKGQEKGGS
jgi:hypothetical protein